MKMGLENCAETKKSGKEDEEYQEMQSENDKSKIYFLKGYIEALLSNKK
jgi:hypothetical protein